MKIISVLVLLLSLLAGCSDAKFNSSQAETEVNAMLDLWHLVAANARYDAYFGCFDDSAVFIGTDAREVWSKEEFASYAKPHFDKGKAWNFRAVRRNVFFSEDGETAWFDELLSTQMKLCRGSGVLRKTDGGWKIAHYVLSMTIPNEKSAEVIELKEVIEDWYLMELAPELVDTTVTK